MSTVQDVLRARGREVFTVDRYDTVRWAVRIMAEQLVGSVVVVDDGQPAGLLTERRVVIDVVLHDRSPDETYCGDVMRSDLCWVEPETPLEDCMELMTRLRMRHLLVRVDGSLGGLVSIGDVVKHLAEARGREVQTLLEYIQQATGPVSWVRPAS